MDFVAKITFSTEVPELLTFPEAAEILGTSRPYIYYLVDNGRLHRVNVGDGGYLLRFEVEELKKAQNKEAGATTTPASH